MSLCNLILQIILPVEFHLVIPAHDLVDETTHLSESSSERWDEYSNVGPMASCPKVSVSN